MRAIITIVIIVILLLGSSLTSYQFIQTSTQALVIPLDAVEKSISTQKWEEALKELKTAQLDWDNNKTILTIIVDHQDVDIIDISISRLEKYIEAQDLSLSLGEVSVLKLLVDHISDAVKLNLGNIL